MTGSQIREEDDNCELNPFLDCTSSEIIIGTNSFINNNTSLEVDIASIPSSTKKISNSDANTPKPTRNNTTVTSNRSDIKAVRSIEK